MSVNSDILVEISDYNLPKLAALYKNHTSWAPHVVALVRTAIQWKQLEDYRDAIKFYSPHNCWETDGTVIVTTTFSGVEVYVLTLDEECTNLYKGLTETKIFDKATQHFLFFGVHERWVAAVRKSILHINREIKFDTPCYLYAISPGEAKQLKADCPPEVYVKRLGTSAAPLVDRTWPHRFEGSVDYLAKFLAINGGYGVFLKSNDEMVASVLRFVIGNISLLYTEEKHRNKGYASLMVRVLSKEIGEEGLWPVATIITDNQNSLHMFEKLGFLNLGKTYFIGVK